MIKYLIVDTETGGLDHEKHPIIQVAAQIYYDTKLVDEFNEQMKPEDWQIVDPKALQINNTKPEELEEFQSQKDGFKKFIAWMDKHVDKYQPEDKFYQVGYNIHKFDADFLRSWFAMNKHSYYGSYFWNPPIDVMLIAAFAAIGQRQNLPNFKLVTVAKSIGIIVEDDKLHDAMYDTKITAEMFFMLLEEFNGGS